METKTFEGTYKLATLDIKTAPTDGSGTFTAYLATWDVDRDNERFAKGAFDLSIMNWKIADDMPPIFWSHAHRDPDALIGTLTSMVEDEKGLLVEGRLDLSSKTAVSIYERLLTGTLRTLSVGFIAHKYHRDGEVTVIDTAEILEGSFTAVPANPKARLLSVKKARKANPEVAEYNRQLDAIEGKEKPRLDPDLLAQAYGRKTVLPVRHVVVDMGDEVTSGQKVGRKAAARAIRQAEALGVLDREKRAAAKRRAEYERRHRCDVA